MKPGTITVIIVATVMLSFGSWCYYDMHNNRALHMCHTVATDATVLHSVTNTTTHSNTAQDGDNDPHHCDAESHHSHITIGHRWSSR